MNLPDRWKLRPRIALKTTATALIICLVAGIASSQRRYRGREADEPSAEVEQHPGAEFRLARVKYLTFGGAGSHGLIQPWWAIDYPYAERALLRSAAPRYQSDGFRCRRPSGVDR